MVTRKAPQLQLVKTATPVARAPARAATRAAVKPAARPSPEPRARAPAKHVAKVSVKEAANNKIANNKAASRKTAGKKVAAAAAASPTVRLFQIYFRPEQRTLLDPAFEPYNNEGDHSPLLEFNVFRKLAASELTRGATLWGALSWKFGQKTGMTGAQLRDVIASNPGCDVYYCNPFPELEGLYHNLWLQGETSHPNFLILCRDFFKAAGLDESALEELQPSSMFASSNYFVATPAFWKQYLDFMDKTLAKAEKNMSTTARAMIYSSAADKRGLHSGANYLPFIIERLFGYFLARTAKGMQAYKFAVQGSEQRMNVHVRLLKQMRDAAVHGQSLWLASCWVNYRSLFLLQFYGKEWCQKYLMGVTPQKFVLMTSRLAPSISEKKVAVAQEKS